MEDNLPKGDSNANTQSGTSPDPIQFTQTNTYKKEDPPLVDLKVTNPVTYFKRWFKRLLANEGLLIGFRFRVKPLTAIAIILVLFTSGGVGFSIAKIFFPTSSPILHREISTTGTVYKTEIGEYYITTAEGTFRLDNLPPNAPRYQDKQVLVKGRLGKTPNVITVSQIFAFEKVE